jgi:hypothetical protein
MTQINFAFQLFPEFVIDTLKIFHGNPELFEHFGEFDPQKNLDFVE